MRLLKSAVLAGALLLGSAVAAPAASAASPAPESNRPGATLRLWVDRSDIILAGSIAPRVFALTCDPDGGTHPHPEKACELLRSVDGDFRRLNVNPDAICITLYAPVTAHMEGVWQGRKVSYQKTYGNSCWLAAATGAVFAFQ